MKNQALAIIGLGLLLASASAYAQTGVVKAKAGRDSPGECLPIGQCLGKDQTGFSPLPGPVLPGPDLGGGRQPRA
jgi:hypothetical protein